MHSNESGDAGRSIATPHPEYQDHADKGDDWIEMKRQENEAKLSKRSKGGTKETFPMKLHAMLDGVEISGHTDIVRWHSHGRAFQIFDKQRFTTEVLPRYYRYQTEYLSFQRQLNVYEFLKMNAPGPDQNGYYHPLFLRGKPALAALIIRSRGGTSRTHSRRFFDPNTEPDLYSFPPLPDNISRSKDPPTTFRNDFPSQEQQSTASLRSSAELKTTGLTSSDSVNCSHSHSSTNREQKESISEPPHASITPFWTMPSTFQSDVVAGLPRNPFPSGPPVPPDPIRFQQHEYHRQASMNMLPPTFDPVNNRFASAACNPIAPNSLPPTSQFRTVRQSLQNPSDQVSYPALEEDDHGGQRIDEPTAKRQHMQDEGTTTVGTNENFELESVDDESNIKRDDESHASSTQTADWLENIDVDKFWDTSG